MLMPDLLISSVYDINDEIIKQFNIKGIIFDIDNTLVGFKERHPPAEIVDFINKLRDKGIQIAIASNNNYGRVSLFCRPFGVIAVSRAMKPLGYKLRRIAASMGLRCKEIALVGDQVYTDSLGANLLGMTSILTMPLDVKETLLFRIKRAMERPVIAKKRRLDAKSRGEGGR